MNRDQYGHPLDDVLGDRFHGPVSLPSSSAPAEHHAHQVAYNNYQERFRVAYMSRILRERPGRSS